MPRTWQEERGTTDASAYSYIHSNRPSFKSLHHRLCDRLPGQSGGKPDIRRYGAHPCFTGYQIFGLVHDIHIDDDGLVRQLVTADHVSDLLIQDNRLNRNIPAEISVLFVGYQKDGKLSHLLPPRPPLSLDEIFSCCAQEMLTFTAGNRFGYFRHILGNPDLPTAELLAAHLQQTHSVYLQLNDETWLEKAVSELIVLLRDDYETLNRVLGAISEIYQD